MPETEQPFVHSLQSVAQLALKGYPISSEMHFIDQDAAEVLTGLEEYEKLLKIEKGYAMPGDERAQHLAWRLAEGPQSDPSKSVETASWMVLNYKPFKSWDERNVRLFLGTAIMYRVAEAKKVLYEFETNEAIHLALFSVPEPTNSVALETWTEIQEKSSILLERLLERASPPPPDLRNNK